MIIVVVITIHWTWCVFDYCYRHCYYGTPVVTTTAIWDRTRIEEGQDDTVEWVSEVLVLVRDTDQPSTIEEKTEVCCVFARTSVCWTTSYGMSSTTSKRRQVFVLYGGIVSLPFPTTATTQSVLLYPWSNNTTRPLPLPPPQQKGPPCPPLLLLLLFLLRCPTRPSIRV